MTLSKVFAKRRCLAVGKKGSGKGGYVALKLQKAQTREPKVTEYRKMRKDTNHAAFNESEYFHRLSNNKISPQKGRKEF